MAEIQQYPYLIWRLVPTVDSKTLKCPKIVAWSSLKGSTHCILRLGSHWTCGLLLLRVSIRISFLEFKDTKAKLGVLCPRMRSGWLCFQCSSNISSLILFMHIESLFVLKSNKQVSYQDTTKILDPVKFFKSIQNFIDIYGMLTEGECARVRICEGRFALLIGESYLQIVLENLPADRRLQEFIQSQGSSTSTASESSLSRDAAVPIEAVIEDMQSRIKRLKRWHIINKVLWTFLMSALVGYILTLPEEAAMSDPCLALHISPALSCREQKVRSRPGNATWTTNIRPKLFNLHSSHMHLEASKLIPWSFCTVCPHNMFPIIVCFVVSLICNGKQKHSCIVIFHFFRESNSIQMIEYIGLIQTNDSHAPK